MSALPDPKPLEITEEDITKAEKIKAEANKAFSQHMYEKAVGLYTEAISFNPKVAAYYTNRAFANIKLELYGAAILDCNEAIGIEQKFSKAFYRRAIANMALGEFKQAVKDFRTCCQLEPGNQDVRKKLVECEKENRARDFAAAIACDEESAFKKIGDVNEISVEESYKGPHLIDNTITKEFIVEMLQWLKDQKCLHRKYTLQIMVAVNEIFLSSPPIVDVKIPADSKLTVCGDIHGQFYDLLNVFEKNGIPKRSNF